MRENVWKEQQYQLMYRTFKINPFKKQHLLTEKAMPQKALEDDEEKERVVVTFLEEIRRARLEPRKKYTHPQTSSQEIGWYTSPLIDQDQRQDFHRKSTEITNYMDAAWRLKEQIKYSK